jgi:DNA-binding MarR family transcriptional regulator
MIPNEQLADFLKLENQVCFPLYACSRLIIQSYDFVLADFEITYPQYLVLLVLWEQDGLSVKDIGEKLFLDSGTLTPILKKLSTQKIIKRQRSSKDDRIVLNFLTPLGIKLKQKIAKAVFDLFCRSGIQNSQAKRVKDSLNGLASTLLQLRENQNKEKLSAKDARK